MRLTFEQWSLTCCPAYSPESRPTQSQRSHPGNMTSVHVEPLHNGDLDMKASTDKWQPYFVSNSNYPLPWLRITSATTKQFTSTLCCHPNNSHNILQHDADVCCCATGSIWSTQHEAFRPNGNTLPQHVLRLVPPTVCWPWFRFLVFWGGGAVCKSRSWILSWKFD